MARSLNDFVERKPDQEAVRQRRLDSSTGRIIGAAIAVLITATVVVGNSTNALQSDGTGTSNELATGRVSLEDDDRGRSLVTLENMAPGRPQSRCLTVEYTGTILPVALSMAVETSGDVAEFVTVRVERGLEGSFESCDGFSPTAELFDGTLATLADEDAVAAGVFRTDAQAASFRFTFDLLDVAEAADRSGSVDFVWEAVPL